MRLYAIGTGTFFKLCVLGCLLLAQGDTSSSQTQPQNNPAPQTEEQGARKGAGGMRRAPLSMLPIIALLAMKNSRQSPQTGPETAAIPSLKDLKVNSEAEKYVLQSIREGHEANFEGGKDGRLNADFVQTILFRTAASAVPNKLISIRGARIQGQISVPGGSSPVPNNIVFNNCTFQDAMDLSGGRFEQSLIFINSEFRHGLRLDLAQVKGDVSFIGDRFKDDADAVQISMSRAQIEGQLQIVALSAKSIVGEGLKVKNVMIVLGDDWTESIVLPQIESESLTLSHKEASREGRVGTLNVEQGSLKELWLQASRIGYIDAQGLRVTGVSALDPNLTVDQKLDLANAHLEALFWSVPSSPSATQKCESTVQREPTSPGWPCEIFTSGLSFDDLTITREGSKSDLNNQFLDEANSSESAFVAYEQILRSRGDLTRADAVYSSMRAKRRSELWRTSKGDFRLRAAATIQIVLDKSQSIFLGYGRFPEPPFLWSLGFVALGALLFERRRGMETSKKDETDETPKNDEMDETPYSRFWYSLELFLPVVELGMAKSWRPKNPGLRTYARLHQLAGWILVPVSLAALTGAIK
jgi:hypothetical protein